MWWFEIGNFPHGVDAEESEWMIQVVEWCTSYLAFCCGPPLLGSSIDGIATEEESAQGTSVSGEVPWGIALFYGNYPGRLRVPMQLAFTEFLRKG